jgi:hypothetical protein
MILDVALLVQKHAMVVHFRDADIALTTVVCPIRFGKVAFAAKTFSAVVLEFDSQ